MRLDEGKAQKRVARWQTIAEGAAEQSRRGVAPRVRNLVTMEEAVAMAREEATCRFIPYELQETAGTRALVEAIPEGATVAVFIGPEGGFTEEEIALARDNGIEPISLGRRILRTETAGLAFLSWLIYRFEIV